MTTNPEPFDRPHPPIGRTIAFLSFSLCAALCPLQGAASYQNGTLELDNGLIRRVSRFDGATGRWSPVSIETPDSGGNLLRGGGAEFAFVINGESVTGASGWQFVEWKEIRDDRGGEGAAVTLRRTGISVEIRYWLYPGLPVLRKQLRMTNTSGQDLRLESVDVDSWPTAFPIEKGQILRNYARSRDYSPLEGGWDDPLVVVHDFVRDRGIAIGNEAPGVLKRTAVFQGRFTVEAGVTRAAADYPFRRWLAPGGTWESPKIFVVPYANAIDPSAGAWKQTVRDFVRRHLVATWPSNPPLFLYDSWIPFLTDIREDLLEDLALRASKSGFDTLAVDYGWSSNQGDWKVNTRKFPNGLAPLYQRSRNRGMHAGIWMSIAMVDADSDTHARHPEWLVTDDNGVALNIHGLAKEMVSTCLGTGWYDHIRDAIFRTIREFDLRYLKLDFAAATSAYIHQPERAGCRAKNHSGHRDREESIVVAHERMAALADEIRREFPQLYLDITFEAWGKLQQIDYALIQHAHGDWLSNISEPSPSGALQMRTLAWSRSVALPTSAMIIGNLKASDPMVDLNMASLSGAIPVMLGDLRLVDDKQSARLRAWAQWFRHAQGRHDILKFRQDLPGFGEPTHGQWDGYARINTETQSGGIVGIFRESAAENTRTVMVDGLHPQRSYRILRAPEGNHVATMTGQHLAATGLPVTILERTGGQAFELSWER